MYWGWLPTDEEWAGRLCTVCGRDLSPRVYEFGIVYFPENATDQQYGQIENLWNVDPFADFLVCEDCMGGHCGAVRGLTADKWLADHWRARTRSVTAP
jgi:hypothetical protein